LCGRRSAGPRADRRAGCRCAAGRAAHWTRGLASTFAAASMAATSAVELSSLARRLWRAGGADRKDVAAGPVMMAEDAGVNDGRSLEMWSPGGALCASLGSSAEETACPPTGFATRAASGWGAMAGAAGVRRR
jgi:hypothetical protein